MAIKTLRVFQEFTSEGYVPMPIAGNIDYGVTIAGTFPGTTPTTFQTDDPDIDVTLTATTDYYVWIRSHGTDWNPMYTRNVRVYPDSPLVNNVVMGIIIANLSNTVPYVGATEDVDLGEFGLTAGYLGLDLTPTLTPTTAGTMSWNDADGTANLILKGGNVTLQIGQEQVTRIVNKTGANLLEANYQAVRISGAQGNRLKVDLAQANIDANSAETLGLVTETINNNAEGFITTSGLVRNIDTTGTLQGETWIDGDILYLSGTTAGRVTNIKPQAPTHTVIMGYVVRAHQTQGQIYVKVDNGYELDELHNVKITSVVNKNILVYETATSLWKNRNIFGTQGYVPYYDDTLLMKNSVIYTDGTQVIIGDDEEFSVGNKLSVVGNIAVDKNYGYHSGLYQILFRQDATGEFRIGTNAANDYTTFYANGTERVRISPSGFLGVGVSNPLSILHVKGTTAYTNAIIDNNSASGGGYYSAYQNGAEKAIFGVSGAWLLDNSSDASIIAKGVGQGIQFYTNGSTSEKMGINSDGNVFVGQTPTYVAGATQLVVRGKTGAGFVGVNHYDMSIKGFMNTFNSVFQVGTSTFHSLAFLVEDIERGRVNSSGRLLWGTTTDNTTDLVQINGSLIATSLKKSGGLSTQFLKADGSVDSTTYGTGTVTSVGLSAPTGFSVSGSPITTSGTLALSFASGYSLPSDATQGTWDTAYNRSLVSIGVSGTTTKTLTLTKQDGTTLSASWSDINTDAVTSVFGRTGAIVATSGDYTTAQVTESGNLYYLDSRARASISGGTGISYNSTTGVITNTITQYTDALARASISGGTGISYNSTSGVITNTITQYTDALARASLSFVAGSGAYNSTTGVITIPTNTSQLTNGAGYITGITSLMVTNALGYTPVTNARQLTINGTTYDLSADRSWTISGTIGGLTSGYIPKATSASTLGNSLIYDNGTQAGFLNEGQFAFYAGGSYSFAINGVNVPYFGFASGVETGGSGNATVFISGYDSLKFYTTNSERMRLTSGGNLLVGTTTDGGFKLDVNGQARFKGSTNEQLVLDYTTASGGFTWQSFRINGSNKYRFFGHTDNSFAIYSDTAATQVLTIASSGSATFSSSVTATNLNLTDVGGGAINNQNGNLFIQTPLGAGWIFRNGASGYAEYMRITSAGNLLVGTTTDSGYKLDVNGIGRFSGGYQTPVAIFERNADYGQVITLGRKGVSASAGIGYPADAVISFLTNGSERARIDSSGNLGLGVTPSAWGGNFKAIQFGTTGILSSGSGVSNFGHNYYFDGTNAIYLTTTNASLYQQTSGQHAWFTAPSGTAGTAISFTQAMTLDASGNLMVGTTNTGYGKFGVYSASNTLIGIANSTSYAQLQQNGADLYINTNLSGAAGGNLIFRFGASSTEAMRIASSTNVLIGTTTDSGYKLDVNGSVRFSGAIISTGYLTTLGDIFITGASKGIIFNSSVNYNTQMYESAGSLYFRTGGIDRLTLASTGAATFSSSVQATTFSSVNSTPQMDFVFNANTAYKHSIVASNFSSSPVSSNILDFRVANGANSQVTVMNLTGAGNVGIGTTSPNYTTSGRTVLDINGTSQSMYALSVGGVGKAFLFYTGTDLLLSNESNGSIKFNTNGSQKGVIDSSGNFGIGTASPNYTFDITGAQTYTARIYSNSADTRLLIHNSVSGGGGTLNGGLLIGLVNSETYFYNYQNGSAIFGTNGTERMRITSDGSVGINNTTPINTNWGDGTNTKQLSINAPGYAVINLQGGSRKYSMGSGGDTFYMCYDNTAARHNITVLFNGNVGINTTTPSYRLQSDGESTAGFVTSIVAKNPSTNAASAVKIGFDAGGTIWGEIGASYNSNSPYLGFYVRANSEKMRITDGGNVLIGTTTDSGYKLDVNGTGNTVRIQGGTNIAPNLRIQSAIYPIIDFISDDTNSSNRNWRMASVYNQYGMFEITSSTTAGGTDYTSRLAIANTGNVLIGTTTDATGKLQVNGTVYATGFYESSSIAYKNILATNPTTALNVDVIKYTRKNVDSDDVRYGYSAEQINSLMPELTNKDVTAVKYLDVHTLLIAELQREIKELKSKLK